MQVLVVCKGMDNESQMHSYQAETMDPLFSPITTTRPAPPELSVTSAPSSDAC